MSNLSPQSDWLSIERRRDAARASAGNLSLSAAQARKSKSIFQSILEDAQQSPIAPVVGAIGTVLGTAFQGLLDVGRTPPSAGFVGLTTVAKTGRFTQEQLESYTRQAEANAPLGLGAAGPITVPLAAAEKAFSEAFAKPLSAGLLLANTESPLYQGGLLELPDGEGGTEVIVAPEDFWGRVSAARRRAEVVPFSRSAFALPANPLNPIGAIAEIGGFDSYDPWSDASMAEASENPFYNFVTGVLQIAPEVALPFVVRPARLAAQDALGLRTTIKGKDDLDRLRQDYEVGRSVRQNQQVAADIDVSLGEPLPPLGRTNPYYEEINFLAGETRLARIKQHPFVANATGVDKTALADIIRRTNDPDTLNELFLASRGDVNALRNLAEAAPDDVWQLAGMNDAIRNSWIEGTPFRPTGEQLARVNQVFDSAVARSEYFTSIRNFFMDGDGFRGQATWIPTRHSIIEKVRSKSGAVRYAVRTSDYSDAPTWITKRVNSGFGRPATVFAQWASSRQPLGTVSLSGTRPDDWAVELTAMMDSVPELRGMREVTIGQQLIDGQMVPVRVSAPVYRQALLEKIADGKRRGRFLETWREVEDELIYALSDTIGLDRTVTQQFVRGYRQAMDEQYGYTTTNGGFFFDEAGDKVILHPQTVSQMLNSFPTTPLGEIALAMKSELSPLYSGVSATGAGLTSIFDSGLKFFRTNVLLRPGYTLKFGVTEPLIAMYLAQGSILTDEGLLATARNVGKNMKNRTKRVAYVTNMDQVVNKFIKGTPVAGRKDLRKEIDVLLKERNDTKRAIDDLVGEFDLMRKGKRSPKQIFAYQEEVRGSLVQAQLRLNAIEDALDQKIPTWRQVVEPAGLSDVRSKISEYRGILGDEPDYAASVQRQIDEIRLVAAARSSLPTANKAKEILQLEFQLSQIDERLEFLSESYDIPKIDVTDIPATVDGDIIARGRDAQAVALRRQKASLEKQIDKARDELDRMEESGIDVFAEATYTSNEAAQLDRLEIIAERLKTKPKDVSGLRAAVEELEEIYDKVSDFLARDPKDYVRKIEELEKKISIIDNMIGATQVKLGERRRKIASVSGITGYAGSGQGYTTILVGGREIPIPSAFSTRAQDFGTALRSEASAGLTTRKTYDPSYRMGHETAKWRRTGELDIVEPTDVLYWDELAWIGNNQMRNDPLVRRILEGETTGEIAKWLESPDGRKYQRTMGKSYLRKRETYSDPVRELPETDPITRGVREIEPTDREIKPTPSKQAGKIKFKKLPDIDGPTSPLTGRLGALAGQPRGTAKIRVLLESTTELDEIIRIVNQYFPDPKVRQALAADELSPGQLQRAMGNRQDLSRIVGEDLQYLPSSTFGLWRKWYENAIDALWRWIATDPEDRIARWPFINREFQRQMQLRVNVLASQGVRLDPGSKQLDSLRQASKRAALEETEKVFYNIRRYNNPVYMSRFLMSFPGAFFNSFYRYGRLAVKEPERTFQAALFAENIIKNGSVDEEGNPVDDIRKAKYILIPGTKRSETDLGVRVPVESLATLIIGPPGFSYAVAVSLSAANRMNPKTEELARKVLGPLYEEMLPYGIARNPASTMFGSWQKDVWRAVNGVSDYDFIQTAIYTYSDAVALWEKNGREGDSPTFDEAIEDTRAFYFARARSKFGNAFSIKQDAPGQLMRNAWFKYRDQFGDDTQGAREAFMKNYGDWARWYTYSSSEYSAFVPSTVEAYERIWEQHPELTKKLVSKSTSDLTMLNLLTLGTSGEFSQSISNFLRDNPLPGDSKPVVQRMQIEKFDNMVRVNDGWDEYSRNKVLYDAEMIRLRTLRDEAPTETMRGVYRSYIAQLDGQWRDWIGGLEKDNRAWAIERTEGGEQQAKKAALYLEEMFDDKKFNNTTGKLPIYQDIKYFLDQRKVALEAVRNAPDDQKKEVKRQFAEFVSENISQNNPDFGPFFDRYFSSEWEVEDVQ